MNPFLYGNIVSGEYFYDRKSESERIKQTLSGGNNLVLYAPRRYGKSSLVLKVLNELEREGFTTLYLDFMTLYTPEIFIKTYSEAVLRKSHFTTEKTLKKIAHFIQGIVPSVSFDQTGTPSFSFVWNENQNKNDTLMEIINLPEKIAEGKKRWIIAFDEFQEVTKLNGDTIEKLFRSCIQHHQSVNYLFLGSRTHLLKDMFNNKARAFYNAAMLIQLDVIDTKESVKYLTKRFARDGLTISEKICLYLIDQAGNIPYYIQFLAAEIWQFVVNQKKTISTAMVDSAIDRIISLQSDYYWELVNKQTNNRKKILSALCDVGGKSIFSQSVIKKYDLGAASTLQKAIQSFVDDGILERFDNKYMFCDPFYQQFIKRFL